MAGIVNENRLYPGDKYVWFKRGRDFIILEKPTHANDLTTADDPTSTITNGVQIEFTAVPTWTVAANSNPAETEIPADETMTYALLDYVKSRMAEDLGDFKAREYYEKKFRQKVREADDNKIGGLRQIRPILGSIK
tara:strand:+ start:804 stop:1211 length:408 start_codon:yes stop_codon:yes gene_type:complete